MSGNQHQQDRAAVEEQIVELAAQGQDTTRLWQMRDRLLAESVE